MKEYIVRCEPNKMTYDREIVRCKDCKWFDPKRANFVDGYGYCERYEVTDKDSHYCSYGEKQVTGKLDDVEDSTVTEDSEACKEQESKLESDLISRQAATDALRNINAIVRPISESDDVFLIDKAEAMTELMMLPSAQPEVVRCRDCRHNQNCDIQYHAQAGDMFFCAGAERRSDKRTDKHTETHACDCISRQAAIKALGEEPDIARDTDEEWAEHDTWARHIRAIESLPSVESKLVCEDAISRETVMEVSGGTISKEALIQSFLADCECKDRSEAKAITCSLDTMLELIEDAPLVEPELQKGEWIFNPKDAIDSMFTKPKCNKCGFESADGGNFCSNCGADMRGDKE